MAVKYILWEMDKRGIEQGDIDSADVLLVSCVSTEAQKYLAALRKKYKWKLIISGGAASTSPYSLGLFSDAVVVGDGQAFLDRLFSHGPDEALRLPNVWRHGDTDAVSVDYGFPFHMPPIQCEDGAYRLYVGRGCKNKCAFCQTGWAYEFKEHPDSTLLIRQAQQLVKDGRKIAYLTNDISQHPFFKSLPAIQHGSCSVRFIRENGLPTARQLRLGIEGVSSRLRKLVGKPIEHDDLVKCTAWLNANKKAVRWFLIAGLPSETQQDWQELKSAILEWKLLTPKGVLELSFTAWCPDPATPMATLPLDDSYWDYFEDFKKWFFEGPGWSPRIKLYNPQQPKSRLHKAMCSMGKTEGELRSLGGEGPNSRVLYPYEDGRKKARERILNLLR